MLQSCETLLLPFAAATFVDPHSADVLREPGRTLYTSFIGEVALQALGVDDGVWGLDAHEAPGAAAQISEVFIFSGYGRYSARRVVACYGDDGDGLEPRELL